MDMKRISARKLRAIGYDPKERLLRAQLDALFGGGEAAPKKPNPLDALFKQPGEE